MKSADKMAAELNSQVLAHSLHLSNGHTLIYRDLVLALGADPIRLPLQGNAADTALSVNDLDDFARFAQVLDGTGIRAEFSSTAEGLGLAADVRSRRGSNRGFSGTGVPHVVRPLARVFPLHRS